MLELNEIHKLYEGNPLLQGISLRVDAGETVCLLGPSGSGKSTLLRIIAGLESPDAGRICWDGQDLVSVPAHQRRFGMVFQDYALFPHLDVNANVAFGLQMQHQPRERITQRVQAMLTLAGMQGFEHRRVTDLSGGEQQRVALARALAPEPRLLMFDEPLGALDHSLRIQLIAELRRILHLSRVPAIYVTHDQEEAFALADRVLLLNAGHIVCQGTPQQVWEQPCSEWAARFMGLGNVLQASVIGGKPGAWQVRTPIGELLLPCVHTHIPGDDLAVLVRPFATRASDQGSLHGVVTDVVFHARGYRVSLADGTWFILPDPPPVGEELGLLLPGGSVQCLA